ncbi:MAG: hypothetical protein R3C51_12995 [Parvularculaceae bacterium]
MLAKARRELPHRHEIVRVGVTLLDLTPANGRQLDMFVNDDRERQQSMGTHYLLDRRAEPKIRQAGFVHRNMDAAARRICGR